MRCTSFAGISLDQEIAPFDIAQAEQLLENGGDCGEPLARLILIGNWDRRMSERNPVNFPSLLCLRPSHCGREHQTSDEIAASHSITLSARANNASGTVTPIAFAVLRLITSSNLVGCSTGMSAGLTPRKSLTSCGVISSRKIWTRRGP